MAPTHRPRWWPRRASGYSWPHPRAARSRDYDRLGRESERRLASGGHAEADEGEEEEEGRPAKRPRGGGAAATTAITDRTRRANFERELGVVTRDLLNSLPRTRPATALPLAAMQLLDLCRQPDFSRLATAAVKANLQDVTSGAKRAQEPAGEEIGGEGEDSDAEEAGRRE